MRFEGTDSYVATEDLMIAVNAAIALERPLLIKGEPGTGKTLLAHHVSEGLGLPMESWHNKSTSKASEGLNVYDTLQRDRAVDRLHEAGGDDVAVGPGEEVEIADARGLGHGAGILCRGGGSGETAHSLTRPPARRGRGQNG